jgi:hypothetical protein
LYGVGMQQRSRLLHCVGRSGAGMGRFASTTTIMHVVRAKMTPMHDTILTCPMSLL